MGFIQRSLDRYRQLHVDYPVAMRRIEGGAKKVGQVALLVGPYLLGRFLESRRGGSWSAKDGTSIHHRGRSTFFESPDGRFRGPYSHH